MCNCGNKRKAHAQQSYKLSGGAADEQPPKKMWADVHFEYTGHSALTVTGGVTAKRYRFNHSGDTKLIDYRDAGGMMAVPVLKKVKRENTPG
jgi:hypothetical protein